MDKINSQKEIYKYESSAKLISDIKEFDFAILYMPDAVLTLKAGVVENIEDFLEIRAFNKEKELKVINNNGSYYGRIRTDNTGSACEFVDEIHLLWGDFISYNNGYSHMSEKRGTKLLLPIEVKEDEKAFIKVRNYLKEGIFEFDDYRMVEFIVKGGVKKYG